MIKSAKIKKIAVGMSGGVDSSMTAHLLNKQGHEVVGIFLDLHENSDPTDAMEVCRKLGIEFKIIRARQEFKKRIINYFIDSYERGLTPNPCVVCNKKIKFDLLWEKIKPLKVDFLATGHYARIKQSGRGIYSLHKAQDKLKDQTYFLHALSQRQLARVKFPLGNLTKTEVRKSAKLAGLPVHDKKESQEICFVPNDDTSAFIKKNIKLKKGDIIDLNTEKILGEHQGLPLYTIGQRKGMGLPGGPWYVAGFNYKKNILLATNRPDDLLTKEIQIKNVNWIEGVEPDLRGWLDCKIRYCSPAERTKLEKCSEGYVLKFKKSVRAATPGQFAVFWRGSKCLGGGEIR